MIQLSHNYQLLCDSHQASGDNQPMLPAGWPDVYSLIVKEVAFRGEVPAIKKQLQVNAGELKWQMRSFIFSGLRRPCPENDYFSLVCTR